MGVDRAVEQPGVDVEHQDMEVAVGLRPASPLDRRVRRDRVGARVALVAVVR